MTPHELRTVTQRRLLTDAVFHARATLTVQAVEEELRGSSGTGLTGDERSLATLTAAIALVVAGMDLDELRSDDPPVLSELDRRKPLAQVRAEEQLGLPRTAYEQRGVVQPGVGSARFARPCCNSLIGFAHRLDCRQRKDHL